MSSKKALKQAQKLAFAKHRGNITISKFNKDKLNFLNKINKKNKTKKLFES